MEQNISPKRDNKLYFFNIIQCVILITAQYSSRKKKKQDAEALTELFMSHNSNAIKIKYISGTGETLPV